MQANWWLVTPSDVKLGIGNIKGLVEWWHLPAGTSALRALIAYLDS